MTAFFYAYTSRGMGYEPQLLLTQELATELVNTILDTNYDLCLVYAKHSGYDGFTHYFYEGLQKIDFQNIDPDVVKLISRTDKIIPGRSLPYWYI